VTGAPQTPAPTIRQARPEDYDLLGKLLVQAYAALPGMPSPQEQPDYYGMLANVAGRAAKSALTVYVATEADRLLGSIDFIDDMAQYGSGGTAAAVDNAFRGKGVGKALTLFCIDRARASGKARLVLHTTRAMQTARAMYESLGFVRFPQIDFHQGKLEVFGLQLPLAGAAT
jgi:GNAT superfamily N-acetyltransferase